MELKVSYKKREVEYFSGKQRGEGLEGLIDFIGKNKQRLNKIEIDGKSESYTFLRQIYLLANLVAMLTESSVSINGKGVDPKKPQFPSYPKNF